MCSNDGHEERQSILPMSCPKTFLNRDKGGVIFVHQRVLVNWSRRGMEACKLPGMLFISGDRSYISLDMEFQQGRPDLCSGQMLIRLSVRCYNNFLYYFHIMNYKGYLVVHFVMFALGTKTYGSVSR